MFNKILKAILDVVLHIPQDQRAVVAHVLQVSNACPDQFTPDHVQHLRDWHSFSLDIHFYSSQRVVKLGDVRYTLNRRATAILNKNFYQLHLMQHHQKVGKKIADIDAGLQSEQSLPTHNHAVNLADWVGQNVAARMENRDIIRGDVKIDDLHQTYTIGVHGGFSVSGRYLGISNITHIANEIPDTQPHEAESWGFEYTGEGMVQRVVRKPIPPMPETKPTGGLSNFVGKKVRIKTASKGLFEGIVQPVGFFYGSEVYKIGEHEPAWFYDGVCQNKGLDYYIYSVYEMLPKSDPLPYSLDDLSYYSGSVVKITMKDGSVYQGEVGVDCRGKYGLIGMTERLYLEDIVAVEYVTEKEPAIDVIEPEAKKELEWLTTFNLLDYVGKKIEVKCRDSDFNRTSVVEECNRGSGYDVLIYGRSYMSNGSYYNGCMSSIADILEIRLVK